MAKRFFLSVVCGAVLVSALVSCNDTLRQDDPALDRTSGPVLTTLQARMADNPLSRTLLSEEDGKILWGDYDRISVYAENAPRAIFRADANTSATSATFTGEADLSGMDGDSWLYAIYPYSWEDARTGDVLTVPVGGTQEFFDDIQQNLAVQRVMPHNVYEFPMVARSKDSDLSFFNVCGGIRFTVSHDHLRSVCFKNLDGTPVNGLAQVSFDADGHPVIGSIENGVDEVWAMPGYEDDDYLFFKPGEPFYLVLPPKTYTEGMAVTFRTPSTEATYTISGSFEIKRSVFSQLLNRDEGLEFKPVEGNIPFEDETFKDYCVANFDTDGDGEISYAEALAVTRIEFHETDNLHFSFGALSELIYFENLKVLILTPSVDEIGRGALGYLDLSYFPKLQALRCYSNKISQFDFTHSPDLYYLDIGGNDLSILDVSCLPKLRILYCRVAGLRSLILPENSILEDLWVDRNHLSELNLSGQNQLNRLLCDGNLEMEELDLSGLKNLTRAYCNHGQLKRVYIYGCTSLELLGLEGNDIEFLDIREAPQLKYLYYSWNNHLNPDLSVCPGLEEVYCEGNNLPELDVSRNKSLKELSCSVNHLAELDLTGLGGLTLLECHSNNLTSLDVSGSPYLETLRCGGNYFTSLDVSQNRSLTLLDCVTNDNFDSYVSPLEVIYIAAGQDIPNVEVPPGTILSSLAGGTASQQAAIPSSVRRTLARNHAELEKVAID